MTITLHLQTEPDGRRHWYASSPSYRPHFGTDTLPTAFGGNLPADVVVSEVRRLNPHAEVRLDRGSK